MTIQEELETKLNRVREIAIYSGRAHSKANAAINALIDTVSKMGDLFRKNRLELEDVCMECIYYDHGSDFCNRVDCIIRDMLFKNKA